MTDREIDDRVTSLICRLNELSPRDPYRVQSAPVETDPEAVARAKRSYRETVAAGHRTYALAFITALEEWISALESEVAA